MVTGDISSLPYLLNTRCFKLSLGAALSAHEWQNRFVSWAYPFSLPAPVSGPDFPCKLRDRSSEIRNSWDLVIGVRRITMKRHSVWHSDLWRRLKGERAELKATPDHAWVEAAQRLYKKLQKGVRAVRRTVCKPIN